MIKRDDLADLRKDYSKKNLSLASCDQSPIVQFNLWLDEAIAAQALEPTAMCLATADEKNKPSSRMVLLKSVEENGFVFFSNYDSRKGHQLSQNMQAALTFFWPELERQVRVEGVVQKISMEESDAYFASRPYQSRIGAWASLQSQPLNSDAVLIKRAAQFAAQYLQNVPRPPHWGGYIVKPDLIEFWQGRPSRLHDRVEYQLNEGKWILRKLYP